MLGIQADFHGIVALKQIYTLFIGGGRFIFSSGTKQTVFSCSNPLMDN